MAGTTVLKLFGTASRSSLSYSTWRRRPLVGSKRNYAAASSMTPSKSAAAVAAAKCATLPTIHVESTVATSKLSCTTTCAATTFAFPSSSGFLTAGATTATNTTTTPRSVFLFSSLVPVRFSFCPSSSSTSLSLHLRPPSSLSSFTFPFSYRTRRHATPPVLEQQQQQRIHRAQQEELQQSYGCTRNFQDHTLVEHFENQQGRHQQHQQGQEQQKRSTSSRAVALLAVSPLLFTEWDRTSDPKNELLFLAGNTLGHCTEKFFENEYGQSIFACVLGLVYLALLGYEGKVNGAVWRMKHVFGSNMKMVGHPRYAHAIPKNPLLSSHQKFPTK